MIPLETTLKKLVEETEPVSVASLYALSGLDRADLDKVRSVWPTVPLERRQVAIRHLVDIAEDNFEVDFNSIYRLGLVDADPDVRAAAIDGLWEDGDPVLIAPFIKLLQSDAAEKVRVAAASALGHFVLLGEYEELPAEKVEPVVTALQAVFANTGESIEVRRHAVEALGFRSSPEIDQIIQQAYAQPDERMRVSAVFAMGRSVDDQWGNIVLKEMDAHDPEMRFEAARAAGEIEYAPAVKPLIRLIEDVDDDVQRAAVWSLGQIGGDKARQVLTAILESDAEYLYEIAEEALDELEFNSGSHPLGMLDFEEDDEEWVLDADDEEDEDEIADEDEDED